MQFPAYSLSKLGLSACMVMLANDTDNSEIGFHSVDPGWVKTDMGTEGAKRTPEEAAADIVAVAVAPPEDQISLIHMGETVEW